jgi:hypothetical protein
LHLPRLVAVYYPAPLFYLIVLLSWFRWRQSPQAG